MMQPSKGKRAKRPFALEALGEAFEPLADVLLAMGVTSREAERALRDAMISAARRQLLAKAQRVSSAHVALRCGVDRGEVRKSFERAKSELRDQPALESHRLTRLLESWHTDPLFVDEVGVPRPLPYGGNASFESLVQRYAGNLYPSVVLEELLSVGAVERRPDGTLTVREREYFSRDFGENQLREFGSRARAALRALVQAMESSRHGGLLGETVALNINPRYLPVLQRVLRTRASSFVRLLDEELTAPERVAGDEHVGVDIRLMILGALESHAEPGTDSRDDGVK